MANTQKLTDIVREVVTKQLSPARIVSISIKEDLDHDGDQILRVEVVFEVEGDRLNPEKVTGLVRHLREPLQKIHENRFPVFTFLKPTELDGAAALSYRYSENVGAVHRIATTAGK